MIYTVTFNPAIDYVVWLDGLRCGAVNRARRELIQFGGKGINVSVMLGRLGMESTALGFLAGFTGRAVEQGLVQDGIKTDFIHLDEGFTRINVKLKGGEETEINGQGPAIPAGALEALFRRLDRLTGEDILVLAGSIPSSLPGDIYERILARLDGRGVRAVVDAEGSCCAGSALPALPRQAQPPGAGGRIRPGAPLRGGAEGVRRGAPEAGARNVLVSLAGDGALLLDETGTFHRIAAPRGAVCNSVGRGTPWWPASWPAG